jgi:hypothetical protein
MKKLFFTLIIVLVSNITFSQSNKGLCKVEVQDVSKVTSFGYLLGYSVTFKNDTKKTIDGIYWNVYYYNNANELLKQDNSSFNSTKLIDPIATGFTKTLARTQKVKGASMVIIKISKVHFSDGTSCN